MLSICYSSSKLICLTSCNSIQNLSNPTEIMTFRPNEEGKFFSVMDEESTFVEN
jgi:hypothetical protein